MVLTGLDVISLAVNVMTIVDTVIKLLADLQKAYERQAELPNILEAHRKELRNTRAIVDIVMKENALQIHAIVSDLKDIDDYGNRLRECLDNLSKDRSLIQQYTHQLFKGSKKMAQLSDIMQGLSLSRGNLVLKIQVAHVGLTRAYGNALLVNQKIVEHVNELLQKVLGHGNDLKITEVLRRHGIKQADGKILVDAAALHTSLAGGSWGDLGRETQANHEPAMRQTISRVVVDNQTSGTAMMINARVGQETATSLRIERNIASDDSFMLNYGTEMKEIKELVRGRKRGWSSDDEDEISSEMEAEREQKRRSKARAKVPKTKKKLKTSHAE